MRFGWKTNYQPWVANALIFFFLVPAKTHRLRGRLESHQVAFSTKTPKSWFHRSGESILCFSWIFDSKSLKKRLCGFLTNLQALVTGDFLPSRLTVFWTVLRLKSLRKFLGWVCTNVPRKLRTGQTKPEVRITLLLAAERTGSDLGNVSFRALPMDHDRDGLVAKKKPQQRAQFFF